MNPFVLGFQDIDKTNITVVGGKGANLGSFPGLKESDDWHWEVELDRTPD